MTDEGDWAASLDETWARFEQGDVDQVGDALGALKRAAPDNALVFELDLAFVEATQGIQAAVDRAETVSEELRASLVARWAIADVLLRGEYFEGARALLEGLAEALSRGEQPAELADNEDALPQFAGDVWMALAEARHVMYETRAALAAAEQAVKAVPESAEARLVKAGILFDLGQLDDSEKVLAQALDRDGRLAEAYGLRGRVLTVKQDHAAADKAFARAHALAPDVFPLPVRMDEDTFVAHMEKTIERLPPAVRDYLNNIAIMVEDVPDVATFCEGDEPLSPGSLGVYRGAPPALVELEDKAPQYPHNIVLFRKNLEVSSRDEEDLVELIFTTLLHEIGHYLGLDEQDLYERDLH